mgnify:CR=1 FL=1
MLKGLYMLGVVIVLILMVMGGIIAFLGDKIGSKVGKRRLTMFGLRPKYTSIIITIVSGVLISFLTVAVMTVVNENVRIALFGLNKLKAEMNELNLQIETKNKQLAEGKLLLAKRTDEYNEINQRANSIFEELNDVEQQKASVEAELSLVQDAYNQARQDIDASAEEIKSLEQTKNELSGNIEKLNNERENLINNITAIREGTVAFRSGQVLGAGVLNAHLTKEQADIALDALLNNVNSKLRTHMNIQDKNATVIRVSQDVFNKAVLQLSNTTSPKLVRIISAGNTLIGEPAVIDFAIYDNLLLYRRGEVIFSKNLLSYGKHLNAQGKIILFLHDVNRVAREKGVLFDPLTGSIGQFDGEDLANIIRQVNEWNEKAILTATAKDNIYTEGPVVINVRVERADN